MEMLLSKPRFPKIIFLPPPQSFDCVLGLRGLLVLSTHDRQLFRISHIAIKCCLKCNLSQFETDLHFQTFLGEHAPRPPRRAQKIFWGSDCGLGKIP